ncbi:radical SAM/SPASM domain-containing protein [Pseudanabaena sp. UWO310]|uniref:radical SAM/SPASM domain-containing protein n=1 Tax=Pseudanabaena sp. UWO310 TaxID=2480795 RepID=UPI0011576BC7|nr:radical SAM protein [Pseudanabaena sp. UWO310]TYQ27674.1 radical SAM protein [Pseudanabaena sp. UWO310]
MTNSTSTLSIHQPQYGFYDRLSANFPSQLLVDATEVCNLACIHCPHPDFKKSHHYDGRSLTLDLNAKLVDEVREHGQNVTQYIRYASNGEPLTHPDIYEMLDYAKQNSGVMVTLTTNGTLMTERRIERLLEIGVDVIDISIDAFSPETYSQIRVNGNLNITRSNVIKLIELSNQANASTKVVVSYVEQPLNSHETQDFHQFWQDRGADYVVIRRLHSCSGAKTELANVRTAENDKELRRPCLYPWERIVLNARGDLSFCPSDWVHGSYIADYRTTSIYETWQGEFYQKLRAAHLSNNYSQHSFCGQCPDWKSTRWPHEGRSYADMIEEFKDLE